MIIVVGNEVTLGGVCFKLMIIHCARTLQFKKDYFYTEGILL